MNRSRERERQYTIDTAHLYNQSLTLFPPLSKRWKKRKRNEMYPATVATCEVFLSKIIPLRTNPSSLKRETASPVRGGVSLINHSTDMDAVWMNLVWSSGWVASTCTEAKGERSPPLSVIGPAVKNWSASASVWYMNCSKYIIVSDIVSIMKEDKL